MKNKRLYLLFIFFISCRLIFSQSKVDTAIVIIDSLYFRPYVICEDVNLKKNCTDTIYSILTTENIKNGFLSYINNDIKNKIGEKIDYDKYLKKKKYFDKTFICRADYKVFDFPIQKNIYIRLMYLNSHCDSVLIMEGLFYQNQKYEFYNNGLYKEYDINGRLETEGNYLFTKKGERKFRFLSDGVIQYGSIRRKYRKEKYCGVYIEAKKDGVWKNYKNGKLISVIEYSKGQIIKK
jgi:hypothetical protein